MNGHRLKELRLKYHHTQGSLAEIINSDARQVWRWESGKAVPDANTLAKIAKYFETSTDYLLGLTDEPSRDAGLSDSETQIIKALRRGDELEAVRLIASSTAIKRKG